MKKSIIIVIILIVTIIISAETYEYYQGLINNRIEVDTMYEGNYRVNFISNNQPITKEFTSYARLDTTELNGEVKIDSVMTYYILSLSPTRQSILVQEFTYPKEIFNRIEEYVKINNTIYNNIELKIIHRWGIWSPGLKRKRVYYYNYKGEKIKEYDASLFEFEEYEILPITKVMYKYYGEQSKIILLSDNYIIVYPFINSAFENIRLINNRGEIIYKGIASCNVKNSYIEKQDTLFIVFKQKEEKMGLNINGNSTIILYKIYNGNTINNIIIGERKDSDVIDGLSYGNNNEYIFIRRQSDISGFFQYEVINVNQNKSAVIDKVKKYNTYKKIFIENNILFTKQKDNRTTIICVSPNKELKKINIKGKYNHRGYGNVFILENSEDSLLYNFNISEMKFEKIY